MKRIGKVGTEVEVEGWIGRGCYLVYSGEGCIVLTLLLITIISVL